MEPLLVLLALLFLFGPLVLLLILWGKVSTLEDRLAALQKARQTPASTPTTPVVPPPLAAPAPAVAAPIGATEPPQVRPVAPPVPVSDPWEALRDMGLLPPADLKGEFALGSWWAVRVGGALAIAAVVFLGIWLNLRSTLPAWVRLGEIIALGALGLWGGHRLGQGRRELGRIVFAVGLTVFQFAAWATHGMEKMRVLDTAAEAAVLQFFVAVAVGVVALARADKLIGQLSIVFTAVAVALSVEAGSEPLAIALEAASVAALGAILLSRGGWASSAALGLGGAIIGFLVLYDHRPASAEVSQAIQVGAGLTFLSLWLADRFGWAESGWPEPRKNLFLCAAFFAPAVVGIWVSVGGDEGRFVASAVVSGLALVVGALEVTRRRQAAEVILPSALLFAGAAGAWKVEQRLVWAVWLLSAALAQAAYARFRGVLLAWLAEVLVVAGLVSYFDQSPKEPWLRLGAVAAAAMLAAWRFDWAAEQPSARNFRRVVALAGLGVLVGYVMRQFPRVDEPWVWIVVLPAAALFRQPRLLFALVPAIAWSHVRVLAEHVSRDSEAVRWPFLWALALAAFDAIAVRALNALEQALAKVVQVVLGVLSAILVLKALDAALRLGWLHVPAAWQQAALWALGSALVFGLGEGFLRATGRAAVAFAAQLAFLAGCFLCFDAHDWGATTLPQAPLLLLGLVAPLFGAVRFGSVGSDVVATLRGLFAAACALTVFVGCDSLPGAGISLFWALAAALTFILGFALRTRSYRLLGVAGLLVATAHVILHDVHDILGRIVACAAVAIAFFGVAWLYGKVVRKDAEAA